MQKSRISIASDRRTKSFCGAFGTDRQIETGSGKEPETVRNFEKITYAAVF